MRTLTVYVDGIGIWAPGMRGLGRAAARARRRRPRRRPMRDAKPAPAILPPTERRRAPEPVLLASEAASQAATMAGRDPATLAVRLHLDARRSRDHRPDVRDARGRSARAFADALPQFRAQRAGRLLDCRRALPQDRNGDQRGTRSFAAGLVEAATEVAADGDAVLLAAYDIVARGPLAEVAPSGVPFAVAFVLSPSRSAASLAQLSLYPLQGTAVANGLARGARCVRGESDRGRRRCRC